VAVFYGSQCIYILYEEMSIIRQCNLDYEMKSDRTSKHDTNKNIRQIECMQFVDNWSQGCNVTYVSLGMKLDQKPSALETQLPYLGPRERVDADEVLKDNDSRVSDGQIQFGAVVVLHQNKSLI